TAEPGSTVTVTFPDGTTATGTADDQGNYTVDIPSNVDLNGGDTVIVTATDKDGNTSEPTNTNVTGTGENPGTGENTVAGSNSPNASHNTDNSNSNESKVEDSNNSSNVVENNRSKDNKENKRSKLPETGEEETRNATLFGSLFAGLGALLLFAKRRRKKEDEK
ncbi:MAG: Ig-like domain-containing protein, partial [Staphylococcus xylosus]|nr:Ig-like domain-containing protein [Staphylococcus xylosus]